MGRAAKVPPAEVTHTGRGGGRGYSLEYAAADHEGVGQAGWVEKREGRSLPGASLAAETKPVIGTTPPRSRLGISTLRFRAARVSKRILFRLKAARFLESLDPADRSLRHISAQVSFPANPKFAGTISGVRRHLRHGSC